ncbi:hypothetical protein L198_08129 [Cryptococcus wingfieldii CBS 7118]|uniref:Uncharacterized protein n=1 Tax=Cryptococcus wingfieldii CBS 7118 TaxID=1295528 RepID=A0A1E3HH51_9TREE|nr:hypothetical protein L198_08129 [Cryptococcus wingfieldii CBS 7118]ODN75672.1 hypothetical protein L198_08129 [Cryptococcus wingfieldii CBS 7118]
MSFSLDDNGNPDELNFDNDRDVKLQKAAGRTIDLVAYAEKTGFSAAETAGMVPAGSVFGDLVANWLGEVKELGQNKFQANNLIHYVQRQYQKKVDGAYDAQLAMDIPNFREAVQKAKHHLHRGLQVQVLALIHIIKTSLKKSLTHIFKRHERVGEVRENIDVLFSKWDTAMNINLRLATGAGNKGSRSNGGMAGQLSTESPNSPMDLALTPMNQPSIVYKAAVGELDPRTEFKEGMKLLNDVHEHRRQVQEGYDTNQAVNKRLTLVGEADDEREQEAMAMLHKAPWKEDFQLAGATAVVKKKPAASSSSKHDVG